MLQVGDILLCKRNYSESLDNNPLFKSSNEYKIIKIKDYTYYVNVIDRFIFLNNSDSIFESLIYDYFYTKEEYRKIKLKKLNKLSNGIN